jgi:hypothetical protein
MCDGHHKILLLLRLFELPVNSPENKYRTGQYE